MNRRDDHFDELVHRLAYDTLHRTTLGMAEVLGYAPYDFKLVHDKLVLLGFEPIPHLSDGAYEAAMRERAS